MDDKIQILVFVITFIIFIVSAIMQQKKKPNAKKGEFESIVETLFGIPQSDYQPEKVESQTDFVNTEYDTEDAAQNMSFKKTKLEMVELVNKEGVKGIVVPEHEIKVEHQSENEEFLTHIDAREAIIYSEIMNRKYF